MWTLKQAALAALLACAPAGALASPMSNSGQMPEPAGVSSPGAGYSTGVGAGWQRTPGRRSVQAGGTAAALVIITAAVASTFRGGGRR